MVRAENGWLRASLVRLKSKKKSEIEGMSGIPAWLTQTVSLFPFQIVFSKDGCNPLTSGYLGGFQGFRAHIGAFKPAVSPGVIKMPMSIGRDFHGNPGQGLRKRLNIPSGIPRVDYHSPFIAS